MTEARVEPVPPDVAEAKRRLAQARRHYDSALVRGLDSESSYILLYSAAHNAATAALVATGRRVTSGDRAHAVLLGEAGRLLGPAGSGVVDRLDRARRQRNRVAYEAGEVTRAQLESLRKAAAEAIEAVKDFLEMREGAG